MPTNPREITDSHRLPTNAKPIHYDLTIRTDLKDLKYDGHVTIHLDVLSDSDTIQLNVFNLKLHKTELFTPSGHWDPSAVLYDSDREQVTLDLPEVISAGSPVQLKIDFSNTLASGMTGYYRSSKLQEDGALFAVTQLQPTFARRAFPCWDEPALKATFSIRLISRVDTVNLSNMPIVSEELYSSSEAAFSSAGWLSSKPGVARPLRVYTTADAVHQGAFTLGIMKKAVSACEQLFDIEYPLPKLDTLVVPDLVGAMENWGLIVAAADGLLLDSEKGDLASKKAVARLQSHEIAHMWFGDLTTMEWWNTVYLNEGFATLVGQTIVMDKIFPEWNCDLEFVSRELETAMTLDAKLSSHPIEVEIRDPGMINQAFDALSYEKAASVLRMLSSFVTEDKFLKGVSIYLKKHLYANSTTQSLWEGIAEASGVHVPEMMNDWVKKTGFPVVKVTDAAGGIRVRQDRFLETGPSQSKDNKTIWSIPLRLMTVGKDDEVSIDSSMLFHHRETFIALDTTKAFKLNAGTVGMYRVLYTPERLESIAAEAVREGSIFSVADRMGIVQDTSALAKAGYLKTSDALSLYQLFRHEKETFIWKTIANSLSTVTSTWFEYPDIVKKLEAFSRALFGPIVARLGYDYHEGEDPGVVELRTIAIKQAANSGDKFVIEELRDRFRTMVDTGDDSHISPDLVAITLSLAVKYGSRKDYDFVKATATKSPNPQLEAAAIRALAASVDPELQEETWEYVTTKLGDQTILNLFVGFQGNYRARHFLARKFKENFDTLAGRFAGTLWFMYLVDFAFSALASTKDYQETVEFYKGRDTSMYKMTLEQALDNINARSAWVKRSTQDVSEWLHHRV